MASVMCYVQVLFFKKLQKAVEHGGLIRTCGLSHQLIICDRAYAITILEDFHRRTFKVVALVLSASQCLKFLWDLEISLKALETSSQVS